MKNIKGVTLVALIITIIVMLIIVGITVNLGTDVLRNSQKNKLKTNLYMVQARAATLLEDYLFDETDSDALSNLGDQDSSLKDKVGFTEEDGNSYIYCVWDSEKLANEGISTENISENEKFVIQYNLTEDTVDVASNKGFKDSDGNTYYKLSEL